jgi:sigma-B regulation protein RsbU (phosphoserine phosphatase)
VRKMIPRTRMGIFTCILLVLWILKSLLLSPAARQSLSPGLQFALDFLNFLLAVPLIYYLFKGMILLRRKLVWKIRRRLILAHLFIGAIPILLVVIILYVAALLLYYQLSYYLISNQIGIHLGQIHAFNQSLRSELQQLQGNNTANSDAFRAVIDRDSNYLLNTYPSASIVLHLPNAATDQNMVFGSRNMSAALLPKYQIPRWAQDREFYGLVVEDLQPELYKSNGLKDQAQNRGRLYLRSLQFSDTRPEMPFSIEISVPFDRYLLDRLKSALGHDLLLADPVTASGLNVILQNVDLLEKDTISSTFEPEANQPISGKSVWSILLFPVSWKSGSETSSGDSQVLLVELSTSKLVQNVFKSESNVSKTILGVLQIVVGFFLVVEILSILAGILLTKSITNAVHNLYRGTEFVKRGDFNHRIVVKSDDQLGALASSFNQMTEYVQSLVKERVQKERMERELEIAKDVQEQLFPRQAPRMNRMELTGLCLPARIVSGDYYDFLCFNATNIGIALGDICGKGISAALLMANLQATLRSNVLNMMRDQGGSSSDGNGAGSVARIVKLLNDQIYTFTSANKFASFFYAVYDDDRLKLTYCNAGHNPPLYFNGNSCRRLSVGGTVVGIFSDAEFEEETIQMREGDLLLAYTDGIVESLNEYGEEFGEERLIQVIEKSRQLSADDIQKRIVTEVLEWAYEEERDDDMTIIVAKII